MIKTENPWKSRKLWWAVAIAVAGSIIWYKADTSQFSEWSDFIIWITGLYFGGNVGEHGTKSLTKSK